MLHTVFVLAFFGFGVKAAIFPFHRWLPAASVAPTPVTALLHAVAVVKAGAFAVMRLIYFGFGCDFLRGTPAQTLTMLACAVTIVYGSARALRTPHLKRRLVYSTIANLSYILLAFASALSVGAVGRRELMDVEMDAETDSGTFLAAMNRALPPEMHDPPKKRGALTGAPFFQDRSSSSFAMRSARKSFGRSWFAP